MTTVSYDLETYRRARAHAERMKRRDAALVRLWQRGLLEPETSPEAQACAVACTVECKACERTGEASAPTAVEAFTNLNFRGWRIPKDGPVICPDCMALLTPYKGTD